MIQYLYILVSTPNDNYYEQFLLSATSLKLIMPNAYITLLCDSNTNETLTGTRSNFKKVINNLIVIDTPLCMPQIEVSRWLKTSMRRFVSGDFLFIDCDTIITDNLSSITDLGIKFGACLDKHSLIDRHDKNDIIIKNEKKLKFISYTTNKHYNSGVIYCKDSHESNKILERWHELWLYTKLKGIIRDQAAFNMAIYEYPKYFSELNGIWNCQIAYNGLPFLANSKIIHYFATDLYSHTSPYVLSSNKILLNIKKTGVISDEIQEILKNPRAAFTDKSRIISGELLSVVNSYYFESILFLKKNFPLMFSLKNNIFYFLRNIAKFFVIKSSKKKDGGIKHYN